MLRSRVRVLAIACVSAAAMLSAPAWSAAGIFGCNHCAAPVAAAPACATCAPPTVSYMPTSIYRALYAPAVVTPVAPCSTCASYAVTTYRPWSGGWTTYSARLVPYTTALPIYSAYRPVYAAMPVVAYPGCSSCASCSPCSSCSACAGYTPYVSYSPCSSCSSCASCSPYQGFSACNSGSCGTVTYAAPAPACSSCTAPATVVAPAPATVLTPVPLTAAPAIAMPAPNTGSDVAPTTPTPAPQNASPPKTFQDEVKKPSTDTELKPIPRTDTQLNSMPAPALPDPRDRTAARSSYTAPRVYLISAPVVASPAQDNDGWGPARN